MALCPKCGADNAEGTKFCSECGSPMLTTAPPEYSAPQPTYTPPENPYGTPQYTPPSHYPTGGLVAWSIISILLCMIPGIVALVQALSINSAPTAEEQLRKVSSTKTWCIVATVLGVLVIIINVVAIIFYGADYTSYTSRIG